MYFVFPQCDTKRKLINYFITFLPTPAQISIKAASISMTLRNWSSFEYHISGRLISLPIAFNENHRAYVLVWSAKKLTIDSIDFIVTYSFSFQSNVEERKTLLNTGDLTERKRKEKKQVFSSICDDGTAKKFHFNIYFICVLVFFSSEKIQHFIFHSSSLIKIRF